MSDPKEKDAPTLEYASPRRAPAPSVARVAFSVLLAIALAMLALFVGSLAIEVVLRRPAGGVPLYLVGAVLLGVYAIWLVWTSVISIVSLFRPDKKQDPTDLNDNGAH